MPRPRPHPAPPGPAPRGRCLPGDCGGEPLLVAAAPDARRPSSSRQQSQKEEVLRSRRAPRSAAISSPRAAAAAAAAPRNPRLLPSRAPQPVPRCRLGSHGRRRRCCSSPARPGPRGPSRGRGDSGAPPSCRGAERGGKGGSQYIPWRGGGGGVGRSPGSRRRHPPPTPAPHTSARGAETAGGGGGGRGPGARTPAHAQARASLARTPSAGRAARPRSNPGCRLAGRVGGPDPLPLLPGAEDRRGARAPSAAAGVRETPEKRILLLLLLLLAPARPRLSCFQNRQKSSHHLSPLPFPHLPRRLGLQRPESEGRSEPGLVREA